MWDRIRSSLLLPAEAAELTTRGGSKPSAVLVPLLTLGDDLATVLTRRRADMRRHAGEISFPGGRTDPQDGSPTETALREAEEELGLDRTTVEVLGALPPVATFVTDYLIYPIVGWIHHPGDWQLSPREVDQVLEFPLAALRAGYAKRRLIRRGIPFTTDTYTVDDHVVWGATGRILGDLFQRLPEDLTVPPDDARDPRLSRGRG